jgi:hypothetical protein
MQYTLLTSEKIVKLMAKTFVEITRVQLNNHSPEALFHVQKVADANLLSLICSRLEKQR